jgi:hypothetical protein
VLTEQQIELAHPEAFDFVFGNLPTAEGGEFIRHLDGCRHCRAVLDEYSEIGGIIKDLPPPVEPPAGLKDRTVAAMTAALAEHKDEPGGHPDAGDHDAEDLAVTRIYPKPERKLPAGHETRVLPVPQPRPPGEPEPRPGVTHLPLWRRHRSQMVAVVAAAAAIVIAAIVVPLSLTGGPGNPAQVTVVVPLHATAAAKVFGTGAATARATARQAGESWTFDLTVHGLKPLPGNDIYECWWAGPGRTSGRKLLVTGGSFVVGKSGSATLTMTTGVDPRQFRTMEITAESPGNGALHGPVLLTGQTL